MATIDPTVIFGVPLNPPAVPDTLPVTSPVKSPTNVVAVTIPDVLMETVVPIPTDFCCPPASENSISPLESCLIVIEFAIPIIISSRPRSCLADGSRTIDPVPIVRIPVTLASPVTTKFSP